MSTIAVALSMAAGVLVTASLFIAERAPQGTTFLWIHLIVSGVFLVLGFLLAGIGREVLGVVRTAAAASDPWAAALRKRLARLLILLTVAGLGLSGILALLTYGILARIDEGFAVFG
ncbi:MAG: hypothetical protein COB97_04135 [Paracoccus sp.]|nr:MAG: hypothetical protein COB97_04135 [Paracoccus sp. (in: a-proteobacteria)]